METPMETYLIQATAWNREAGYVTLNTTTGEYFVEWMNAPMSVYDYCEFSDKAEAERIIAIVRNIPEYANVTFSITFSIESF